jgi:hypothetical protein
MSHKYGILKKFHCIYVIEIPSTVSLRSFCVPNALSANLVVIKAINFTLEYYIREGQLVVFESGTCGNYCSLRAKRCVEKTQ